MVGGFPLEGLGKRQSCNRTNTNQVFGAVFSPKIMFTIHHSVIFSDVKYKSRSSFQFLVVTVLQMLDKAMQPAYPQENSCANGQSMNHRFVMPQKYYILSALELLITEGHLRARCKKSTSITGDSPPFNYSKQVTLFMSV